MPSHPLALRLLDTFPGPTAQAYNLEQIKIFKRHTFNSALQHEYYNDKNYIFPIVFYLIYLIFKSDLGMFPLSTYATL